MSNRAVSLKFAADSLSSLKMEFSAVDWDSLLHITQHLNFELKGDKRSSGTARSSSTSGRKGLIKNAYNIVVTRSEQKEAVG